MTHQAIVDILQGMKRKPTKRREAHISDGGRAFLPPKRMAEIRWEESLTYAGAKRDGIKDPIITHSNCHCGNIGCLGVPLCLSPKPNDK
jgi:hypothetical protein